mgnify:CR=1 FL=1
MCPLCSGLLAEEEQRLYQLRVEKETAAREELARERSLLEQEAKRTQVSLWLVPALARLDDLPDPALRGVRQIWGVLKSLVLSMCGPARSHAQT